MCATICTTFCTVVLVYISIPGDATQTQNIIIEQGASTEQISKMLYERGIVQHPTVFTILSKGYILLGKYIKSGEYEIAPHITLFRLFKVLSSGVSVVHRLTVYGGMSAHEVIAQLKSENVLKGDIDDDVQEGIFLPQTYFFSFGDDRKKIVSTMKKLMSTTLDELMPQLSPNSPLKTRMDVLNLASIVEKEASLVSEKPRIAAVFLNRLKKKMKLQADPTTIYGITMGKYRIGRKLTKADLLGATPYNTYYINGLPPSPIACPDRSSIEAVINPAQTNELYFVVNGIGGHNFSATLDAHNKYVKQYRDSLK